MEWYVDTSQGNGGEAALKRDGPRLGLCLLHTLVNHFDEMRLDVLQGHALHKSGNVNVLGLKVVE